MKWKVRRDITQRKLQVQTILKAGGIKTKTQVIEKFSSKTTKAKISSKKNAKGKVNSS